MPKPEEILDWLIQHLWQEYVGARVETLGSWLPDTVSAVFFTIFLVGFLFLVLAFIFGEVFDGVSDVAHGLLDFLHIDFDHPDIDHGDSGAPSAFSPRVIAVFVTIFGGVGYVTSINGQGPFVSSGAGLLGGVAVSAVFYAFFSWIFKQEATSAIHNTGLVGRTGMVRTAIPKNGLGEVLVDYVGRREMRSARSVSGAAIAENQTVVVEGAQGRMLIVSPKRK